MPSCSQSAPEQTEISAEMKSASGLSKKDATKASNPPPILGYIQDVGPLKLFYTHFSSCLQEINEKYNKDKNCCENLDEIDEDKLCEIILESEGQMKLTVNFYHLLLDCYPDIL